MEDRKIRFRDLSGWLKTLVVLGWIVVGLYVFAFMWGFMYGIMLEV